VGGPAWFGGAAADQVEDVRGRRPPSPGRLLRPFEPPPHEYGPGHRGVDLAVGAGELVAPQAGSVAFSGQVAGRGVVVVAAEGPDGLVQHSLEPVVGLLPVGTVVAGGSAVARLQPGASHQGCGGACVHWGVRVAGRYVDPWWWLGRAGPVRLLPGPGP
jgi:murein DD-endopeptidase MepM/ murein hydrolase activator NlpD